MHLSRTAPALLVVLAAGLVACGEDTVATTITTFRATLVGVNEAAIGALPSASAEVDIRSDHTIVFSVSASGLSPTTHPMFLRQGNACPGGPQDVNRDGVVDINEGLVAYGPAILPLDGNITDRRMDLTTFPATSTISYSQSAPLSAVIAAVSPPDPDTTDIVVPLPAGDSLDLANRVITVHGVAVAVPATAAGAPGLTSALSLPILCGRLQLVQ